MLQRGARMWRTFGIAYVIAGFGSFTVALLLLEPEVILVSVFVFIAILMATTGIVILPGRYAKRAERAGQAPEDVQVLRPGQERVRLIASIIPSLLLLNVLPLTTIVLVIYAVTADAGSSHGLATVTAGVFTGTMAGSGGAFLWLARYLEEWEAGRGVVLLVQAWPSARRNTRSKISGGAGGRLYVQRGRK